MKYKVAICDDNLIDQEYVAHLLEMWADEKKANIEIHTFISAEQFLFQYAEEKAFDIVVLDIEMEKMNGVSLAKKLRENNKRIQILFVTGFPDFIAEGYEVDALHYLLKPVNQTKFFRVMDKAVNNISTQENVIFLKINGEMIMLSTSDIFFIEVFSHVCIIYSGVDEIEVKIPISELETKLGDTFVRTYRSHLVNIGHIKRISKTEVFLEDGRTVPLSRRNYVDVNKAFIHYYSGRIGES
jgi:DNA-binding LytR/AlgR family response regulator